MSTRVLSRRQALTALSLPALAGSFTGSLAGCSSSPGKPKGLTPVSYSTSFGAFGRDAYAWVAAAKGFFRDAGLEVTIHPGKPASNPTAVAAGRVDFAAMDFASAVVKTAHDTDLASRMRLVAAVNQHSLIAMMALAGGSIHEAADLAGKRVVVAPGSVQDVLWSTYAELAKIDPPGRPAHASAKSLISILASGQADCIGQFVIGKPTVEKATGKPVLVLPWSEFVTDLYGYVITTNQNTVTHRPEVVQAFTGALLQGLVYAIDHPDEAGRILHTAVPTADPAMAGAELTAMKGYVGAPVGVLDPIRVARCVSLLQAAGAIEHAIDPADLVAFNVAPTPIAPIGGVK